MQGAHPGKGSREGQAALVPTKECAPCSVTKSLLREASLQLSLGGLFGTLVLNIKQENKMNGALSSDHPLRYLGLTLLGLLVAIAGIWIVAAIDLAVVQGMGFTLLAPAGAIMAVGLCRLWDQGSRCGKFALPPIPRTLSQPVSITEGIRALTRKASERLIRARRRRPALSDRRFPSWTE